MKTVALISGGKDSCYNMMQCVAEGHEIVALANLRPKHKDELDSYMFQTVGHHAIQLYSKAMGLPLYQHWIQGNSLEIGKDYVVTNGDEVEDLYQLLKQIKNEQMIEAVSVGAILSNYQRVRVENVCTRLGLTVLAYLWQRNQQELLDEMISSGVTAIIIKVASLGLTEQHLGQTLSGIQEHLLKMKEKYQLNVCGEGGEYETLTLDCPLFNKEIIIDKQEMIVHSDDAVSPVFYLHLHQMHLKEKDIDVNVPLFDRVKVLPMKSGSNIHKELGISTSVETVSDQGETSINKQLPSLEFQKSGQIVCFKKCKFRNGFLKISGISVKKSSENNPLDIQNMAMIALMQIKELLREYKMMFDDLVLINLYLCSMAYYKDVNFAFLQCFPSNPPARVCVQIDTTNGNLFEVDCIAHRCQPIPSEGLLSRQRNTMHVQGISHWAPANIGPYSQAVQVEDTIFCAGVIGLCPSSMKLIEGGVLAQCRLSLRSVDRILCAMTSTTSICNAILTVCYVTSSSYIETAKNEWKAFHNAKLESLDSEFSNPCLIAFVVVPFLPRNAAIEWHVTAHFNQPNWQYVQRVNDICRMHLDCLFSAEDKMATLLVGVENCLQKISLTTLMQEINKLVCNCIADIGFKQNQTLSIQLFFHQKVLHQEQLRSEMAEISEDLGQASLTFIPAKSLDTNRILTICFWLCM
ncbi:uncharacterized protein [Antedon mediterranea]|uniref:uncharacterized protein n=1 Tax=Antedon mediterranea TaxID=105859 RepID=UPI003AF7AFC9